MFSSRLPLSVLIELCRSLRHYLGAGLTLTDVFDQQARRGPARFRPAAARIGADLKRGDSLEDALKREANLFPPLLLSLASVGERTGMLPEVFGELERYFLRQKELRNQFIARISWPVIQFVLAVGVLTLLIFILGQIGRPGERFDALGLGLSGGRGAAIFLGTVVGVLAGLYLVGVLLSRSLGRRVGVARWLLSVPGVGPCLQALALGRFCLALRLTTESGMPIGKALRLSLKATGNRAFAAATDDVQRVVGEGDEITLALARTGLFPGDFERIIAVAEESGSLSEVLRHQGDHYHEEASRRLAALTAMLGYGIWAMVGLFIIVAIFRIYSQYLNVLNRF
jgi:type II secretory pathway component PulF